MPLSVVINTKNAAATLLRTLRSVEKIADEIVVVDMFSTDRTLEIARTFTSDIYNFKRDVGYVEPARNFALSKATKEWILLLDADEEVPPALAKYIGDVTQSVESHDDKSKESVYFLPRKNMIFGQWIENSGWWPDYQLRLFRKGTVEWRPEIHSQPDFEKATAEYLPAQEQLALLHYNYGTVSEYIERLNRYTNQESKSKTISSGLHPVKVFSAEFLRRFFDQHGYKDGMIGSSVSLLQAMYMLTVHLKSWENDKSKGATSISNAASAIHEVTSFRAELSYWLADYEVSRASGINKLYWRVRRKYKI
ncbi:MAG: glycosyltransferase family 2 protein [bacterium]|nr:glycosyltransferase family 2 protein [bacterium]